MDLDPLNRLASNPVDAHINDCEGEFPRQIGPPTWSLIVGSGPLCPTLPYPTLKFNFVNIKIEIIKVKKKEFNLETYETYEWFEQCRVLPNIKATSLPKRINVTIQNFDFEGRAVGELTSLDEMRLNMTERWVSHFHDALLNKYQGKGLLTNEIVSPARTVRAVNRSPTKAYTK